MDEIHMTKPHIGLIGFGAIAQGVVQVLAQQKTLPCAALTILVRPAYQSAAQDFLTDFAPHFVPDIRIITEPAALYAAGCSYVVECANHQAVRAHVAPLLRAGVDVIIASVGALADAALYAELTEAAHQGQARLTLSTGAIGGLDILAAAARAGLERVDYTSTKPAQAWQGTAAAHLIALDDLKEPTIFFQGSARQAAQDYPKNANVAALVALAGIGFERTQVTLIADPQARENSHALSFAGLCCDVTLSITGRPHPLNPKTSLTTIYALVQDILAPQSLVQL